MISVDDLHFRYEGANFRLEIPALEIARGESVALVGPSGAGKTTLLHLLAGILEPRSGEIRLGDCPITSLSETARRHHRLGRIGLVLQEFELLDYLTVRENILLIRRLHPDLGIDATVRERVESLARELAIEGLLDRHPPSLSTGEKQRAAICRALVNDPALVLADEPTSHLDVEVAGALVDRLVARTRERGGALVLLTHDPGLLPRLDRVLEVADYRVEVAS